jgi:excisionase family DNA binding protein
MLVSAEKLARTAAAMLDVQAVATMLSVSSRTVYRLADAGRMPSPVKLGALVRWNRAVIDDWLAAGCPAARHVKGGAK